MVLFPYLMIIYTLSRTSMQHLILFNDINRLAARALHVLSA
jgi:hypothetical protein